MKSGFLTSISLVWFLSALLFTAGAGLNLYQRSFGEIPPTDGVVWVEKNDGIYASKIIPDLSGATAGLWTNDRLVGISLDAENFQEIETVSDIQIILEEAGVGSNVTYWIERRSFDLTGYFYYVDLNNLSSPPAWTASYLVLIMVGLTWLLAGAFVLAKQGGQSPFVTHFANLCLAAFVFHVYKPIGSGEDFDLAVSILDNWSFVLFSGLFMHFCLRYPTRSEVFDRSRWKNLSVYLPVTLLAIITAVLSLYSFALPSDTAAAFQSIINKYDLIVLSDSLNYYFFNFGIALGAFVLIWRYRKYQQIVIRHRLKLTMWATIIAITPLVTLQILGVFFPLSDYNWLSALTAVPLVLIPLGFGHSVVRYRLMDVDVVVRRALVYLLTTLAISSMIGVVALGVIFIAIGENLSNIEIFVRGLIAIIATSLIVLLSEPIKKFLQERAERFFYGEKYDLRRGLLDFGRTISATTALEPLLDALGDRLRQVLDVQKLAVFIEDQDSSSGYRIARLIGISDYGIPERFREMIRIKSATNGVVRADELDFSVQNQDAFIPQELHYFVPCVVRGRMVAVVGLGRTVEGSLLSSEDLDILRTISGYVAVAIENSLLYQEQKARAQELEVLKEFNESIVESVNVALIALDEEGLITRCNTTFEEMFSFPRERVVGSSVGDVFDTDFRAELEGLVGGQIWNVRYPTQAYKLHAKATNGVSLILNIAIAPLRSQFNDRNGAIVVLENVTERVKLEESLQQSEKLSSIGLLAAGIAHEVNTPLTGVSSYTQMLLEMVPESDPKHALLLKVRKQTERASLIAANLLNFSRSGNISEYHPIEMNRLLEDTLQLLEPQLRKVNIELRRKYAKNLPQIRGSAAKLQQVFTNLVINALDAMGDDGILTISTGSDAQFVTINVEDNGKGIAQEDITKIYDPFFTTKGVGSGTGLGLAVSYGIIQEHEGLIEVSSQENQGTAFSIKLPIPSNLRREK